MEPSDEIIRLTVSDWTTGDKKVLNVHRGILCKSSRFYQSAMKQGWSDLREQPGVIELPDDSAETVSNYIRWLYSDKIPIKLYERGEDARQKWAEEAEKVFILLAEAYVYGEKIIDVKYKNAVVKAVLTARKKSGWNMGPRSGKIIYEGTPSGSPIRKLLAESISHLAQDDSEDGVGWMQFFDGYPREALADAMKAMVRLRKKPEDDPTYDAERYLEDEKC